MIDEEVLQLNESDESNHIKRRKLNVNVKSTFKENVLSVLQEVENVEPGVFAVYGKIDAPMITVSIRHVDNGIIHFPLHESNAGRIINWIEQAFHAKATATAIDPPVKSSWRLDVNTFEISNQNWHTFISQVLVPRIKKEMLIKCSFSAYLNGLLLCKTGSLPEIHHYREKSDTMLGTLLIQLPSYFKGGQLTVWCDRNTTKTMDFSSNDVGNTFSTFFCSFNRDCQLQGVPLLEGYRFCLIYDLISNEHRVMPIASQKHALETQMTSLLVNWNVPRKLVYALKHKYSESNLLFEHLKTTDKTVANFLLGIAESSQLHVFLGILNKKTSYRNDDFRRDYEFSVPDFDFDSDDENFVEFNTYTLRNVVAPDGNRILTTSNLSVSLHQEVIPDGCFKDTESSIERFEPSFEINKYYHIAAIVILPKNYFLEILKRDGATSIDIDMNFLKEIERSRRWENDERTRTILLAWAQEVLSLNNAKSLNMIKGIVSLRSLELIKALFGRCVVLNESSIPILEKMCETYGWKNFTSEIPSLFNKLSKEIAVQLLGHLIGTQDLHNEKLKICHDVLKIILDKFVDEATLNSSRYVPHPPLQVITTKKNKDQDILLSICRLSQMVSYNMLEFAKTNSVVVFVPVLLQLVSEETLKLSRHWLEIAEYYLQKMEDEASKPSIVPNFHQMDETTCSCNDCLQLNGFLGSGIDSIRLSMGKKRRRHLQEQMNYMKNISYDSDSRGHIGTLIITKTAKAVDEVQEFSKTFLERLRAVLP